MAAAGGVCARLALCVVLLFLPQSVFADSVSAADLGLIVRRVDRLPEPETFTTTLETLPRWMRECFYRLAPGLQLSLRLQDAQSRDRLTEVLEGLPGIDRHRALVVYLTTIAENWRAEDGFDADLEAAELASRDQDAAPLGRSGGGQGRTSGALTEDDRAEEEADEQTQTSPVVVGPLRPLQALPSLWERLAEARRAGNSTGLWRLSLSGRDDLTLKSVPELEPSETFLPVYGYLSDGRPELVQLTFSPAEASPRQLLQIPDELLRTLPSGAVASLPAPTVTALSVEHAGDVTVTGSLTTSGAANMTNAQLETLVHSLLQRSPTPAELSALAAVVGRHWPDEIAAWSPTHVSVLAAHRCELLAHVQLPALLPLDADTASALLRSCQAVWPPNAGGRPALGPYVRRWLSKELLRSGPLSTWPASALSELRHLLVGALPSELAQIGEQHRRAAGAALAFAGLDRAQAQPVIAGQLTAAAEGAGTLFELLRHVQPRHVRKLGRLGRRLRALAPWLLDEREDSRQYATHLQFRLMLDPTQLNRANVTAEDLASLGPYFYTVPLARVFSLVVEQRVQLSPAQLAAITSSRLEPMTCRLLMSMFMLTGDRLCPGCLRGVPPELLACMTDGSLTQLRQRGRLDADAVAQLVPAADWMLPGKRAELLEAVRRLLRRGGGVSGPVVGGSRELWRLAGPQDMPLLVPAVIARMEELARHVDEAELARAAAEYPRELLGQVLAHYRRELDGGLWSTETLLGRRPGRRRPLHGPWLYLAGLSCADVATVTPLDLPTVAEAYERRMRVSGAAAVPLALCVCLQQRLVQYLQVRHAMQRSLNELDGHKLTLSALEDGPLHRMSVSEVRAVPGCVLLLMPRHYLLSLSKEARLAAWLKIGRLTWPEIASHLTIQKNGDQFHWAARQLLHDLGATNTTALTFEHVAQFHQLLHFVTEDDVARIAPEAFREWIYSLRSGTERLVCRPQRVWAGLVSRAFGPAVEWNSSTLFYLGGWAYAVNATERARISRRELRLAVDDHNAALFQELPDIIGKRSGQPVTFLEACRDLNDTSLDLRPLFEASRLAGVVGYPKPRARRSVSKLGILRSDLRQLDVELKKAVQGSSVSSRLRGRAEALVDELVASLGDETEPDAPEPLPFEFVTSTADRLSCDDLRAAGPAAAAVRPHELAQMATEDLHGLWSCLNTLGRLHWSLGGASVEEVWRAVRPANGDRLLPDNIVHVGNLVQGLSPDELRAVLVAAPRQPLSTDALSGLGAVRWRPDQLQALVNSTLGVTEDSRTSRVRLYSEPQMVSALGSLLCGFSPDQLRQLFNGSRPHLYRDTAAAVGRLSGCPHDSVLETIAEMAVETFGPTSNWSESTVRTVGSAVGSLRSWQLRTLPAESLRGLSPVAARRVAAAMLATRLSPEQLRHLTPMAAREVLAQPGLDTRQQDALMHALLGRRSARAAPDPPPEAETAVKDTDSTEEPNSESEPEPEPELESEPHSDSDSDHHHDPDSEPEPELSVQPRADPEEDPADFIDPPAEPEPQGVAQERANSTAPARLAAHPALWLTALVLAAPAA